MILQLKYFIADQRKKCCSVFWRLYISMKNACTNLTDFKALMRLSKVPPHVVALESIDCIECNSIKKVTLKSTSRHIFQSAKANSNRHRLNAASTVPQNAVQGYQILFHTLVRYLDIPRAF